MSSWSRCVLTLRTSQIKLSSLKNPPGLRAPAGPQELVGSYFFTDSQLERFHKLHTTMRQCGIAFVVVAAATMAVLLLSVLTSLHCCNCMGEGTPRMHPTWPANFSISA